MNWVLNIGVHIVGNKIFRLHLFERSLYFGNYQGFYKYLEMDSVHSLTVCNNLSYHINKKKP